MGSDPTAAVIVRTLQPARTTDGQPGIPRARRISAAAGGDMIESAVADATAPAIPGTWGNV